VERWEEMMLYLFNDLLLVATHVKVTGLLDKTKESVMNLMRQDQVLRPVTLDEVISIQIQTL
jgi:hypothetical protein